MTIESSTIPDAGATAPAAGGCGISVLLTSTGFITPRSGTAARPAADPPGDDHLVLELVRDSSAPGLARRALTEHFAGRLEPSVIADAQLVVSELVSNAVEHGVGDVLRIDAVPDDEALSLSVRSRCRVRDLRRQPEWDLPDPTQISGRGLPIVGSLSVGTPTVDSAPDGAWFNRVTITARL